MAICRNKPDMDESSPPRDLDYGHRPVVRGHGNRDSTLGTRTDGEAAARGFRRIYDVAARLGGHRRSAVGQAGPRRRGKGAPRRGILGMVSGSRTAML